MNLRPSGYEPDELPGCSTPRQYRLLSIVKRSNVIYRPGDDLLSHTLRCSTISAEKFNGRVRNGIVCRLLAKITKPINYI